MKKINIKCIVLNSLEKYNFNIKIYNLDRDCIYNEEISNLDNLEVNLCNNREYIIKIYNNNNLLQLKKIYISKHLNNKLNFYFKKHNYSIIRLTDKNYKGLSIEKGEIIIWQK